MVRWRTKMRDVHHLRSLALYSLHCGFALKAHQMFANVAGWISCHTAAQASAKISAGCDTESRVEQCYARPKNPAGMDVENVSIARIYGWIVHVYLEAKTHMARATLVARVHCYCAEMGSTAL